MLITLFEILNNIDNWFGSFISPLMRLCLWGAIAGTISIAIYAKLSPQTAITKLKKESRSLQKGILSADIEFKEFLKVSGNSLRTSFKLVATVMGPTIIGALPVLFFIVWIHTYQGYENLPNRSDLAVKSADQSSKLYLSHLNNTDISINADNQVIYTGDPFSPPTSALHKRQWWNVVVASPVGYLAKDASVSNVELNFPKKQFLKWMPEWGRGWEVPFFMCVFIAALAIKIIFRIA